MELPQLKEIKIGQRGLRKESFSWPPGVFPVEGGTSFGTQKGRCGEVQANGSLAKEIQWIPAALRLQIIQSDRQCLGEDSLGSKSSFLRFPLPSSLIPAGNFPGELETGKPAHGNGAAGGELG